MTFEGSGGDVGLPPRRTMPHYHGDEVRALFVISALVIIFAKSTGAELPFSNLGAVTSAAALVVAAGITNPKQGWIHWVNAFFAIGGTLLFGTTAVDHYSLGISVFEPSFVYIEALALLSLVALFFTTRTIRGFILRSSNLTT